MSRLCAESFLPVSVFHSFPPLALFIFIGHTLFRSSRSLPTIPSQVQTHTHNYPTVSLPLSRVCRWGQSLGFLSSSYAAVLHHDCNSSSVCNPRPGATRVIRPPPRHDNSARSHAQAHVTRSVMCCGTRDGSDPTLGTGFTDHQTGRNAAWGRALVWLWGELAGSRCSGIRCFPCDDRFILGKKAFCLRSSRRKLKGNWRGTVLAGFMSLSM